MATEDLHVIETQRLTVTNKNVPALYGVELYVNEGEVYGLLGPMGAGKNTLIRVFLDLIRPTHGKARIFGLGCQDFAVAIRRRIGYAPTRFLAYPNMTADDLFDFIDSIRISHGNHHLRVKLCERLNIDPHWEMNQFSMMQKKRVGLIASFLHNPELLIIEEPISDRDPLLSRVALDLIDEARNEHKTILVLSPPRSDVIEFCDRVAFMRMGRLLAVKRREDIPKENVREIRLTLEKLPPEDEFEIDGVSEIRREGLTIALEVRKNLRVALQRAIYYGIADIETLPETHKEVFQVFYGSAQGGTSEKFTTS
jgi:ABC-2 type transport system ATP-binding protein